MDGTQCQPEDVLLIRAWDTLRRGIPCCGFGGGGGSRTPVRKGTGLNAYILSRVRKTSPPATSNRQELPAASPESFALPSRTEKEELARSSSPHPLPRAGAARRAT